MPAARHMGQRTIIQLGWLRYFDGLAYIVRRHASVQHDVVAKQLLGLHEITAVTTQKLPMPS